MERDEQDEGTVGPQFQDDSTETPTCLGSYQQAAREGKVFCPECLQSEESDIYSRPESIQPKLFQCPEGLHQHCRKKHKSLHFCDELISQAKQPLEPSLAKEFLTV